MVTMGMVALGTCHRKSRMTKQSVRMTSRIVRREVVHRPVDEIRAVVADDDLHTLGQPGADLVELLLHSLDDLEGVLLVAHDRRCQRPPRRTVELGDAAPDVGPEDDLAQILDPDGRAELAAADDDLLEVLNGLGVAAAADHVLGAAELHQPAADLGGAVAHCLDHLLDPDAVAAQPVGVDGDLVLLWYPPTVATSATPGTASR